MLSSEVIQQLRKIIDVFLRKKALIASFFFIGIIAGLVYYLSMPRIYQSSALLSYQKQKVNPSKLSPDTEAKIHDMVSTLSQIVTSRTNLENIVKSLNLFVQERKSVSMSDAVDIMQRQIDINLSKNGDTFKITYRGSDPNKVVKATNALAAKFIEENLKYREERATETSAYTTEELQMAKRIMDEKEAVMRDYKLRYFNEMSEQRDSNVGRLTALQLHYQAKQDSIQDLERTKILVQEQMGLRKKLLEQVVSLDGERKKGSLAVNPKETNEQRLERIKKHRDILRLKYTEKHPEIKRITQLIINLEKEISQSPLTPEGDAQPENAEEVVTDSVLLELGLQIKNITLNIEALNREKKKLKKQVEEYEKWVSAAPVREAEWTSLTREYGEHKRHYDYLVAQNLQANSVLNLERKQRGSQFKIEDPARLPERPVEPNFLFIMGIAIFAGLASGGGLAFGTELFDSSFKDPLDIETYVGLPVVCSVPYVKIADEESRHRRKFFVGLSIFFFCLAVIFGLFVYLWRQGRIII